MASMSDTDLQRKLLDYGNLDIPVTDTTRSLLTKKLKQLQTEQGQVPKRKSLLNLSSDESENENASAAILSRSHVISSPRRSSRRLSSKGTTQAPSPKTDRNSTISNEMVTKDESDLPIFAQPRRPMRRSMTAVADMEASKRSSDRGSNSSSSQRSQRADLLNPGQISPLGQPTKYLRRSLAAPGLRSSPGRHAAATDRRGSDSDVSDSSISNIPENLGVDEFPRSRRSMVAPCSPSPYNQPGGGLPIFRSGPGAPASPTGNAEGGFSRSQASWRRRSAPMLKTNFGPKPPEQEASGGDRTKLLQAANGNHDFIDSVNEYESGFATDASPNTSQCVSMILLATLAMFFVIVGLIYLGARHKDQDLDIAVSADGPWAASNTNKQELTREAVVQNALSQLRSLLRKKAGNAECSSSSSLPPDRRVSVEDAENYLKSHNIHIYFPAVLRAFYDNIKLGVRLLDDDNRPAKDWQSVKWLESQIMDLTFVCRLRLALRNTFYKVSVGVAGLSCLVAVASVVFWLWDQRKKQRQEIFLLVEKILEILQNHHRSCRQNSALQPFLAIPHVRDMLIPPTERKSKRGVWDGAVSFIQNNESRIRFETQTIEGEDFLVWRWVQPDPPGGSNHNGGKTARIWQGQAFENLDTGMNALPCSPTPCLKVRNMFDPDIEYEDDWPVHIRDAILEKCAGDNIVHMRVDPLSHEGCVYIKCQNSETAGRVYKALHGWWFDGKLITVKYLRLERYHERFPESVICTKTLTPSLNSAANANSPVTFLKSRLRPRSNSSQPNSPVK